METIVLHTVQAIGHLKSMVELGKLILTQNPSLSIRILIHQFPINTSSTTDYITSVSSSCPNLSFHFLPEVSLLLGDTSNYSNIEEVIFEVIHGGHPHFLTMLAAICMDSTVLSIIHDFFCSFYIHIELEYQVPSYVYIASGAYFLAFFMNFPSFDGIAGDSFRNLGETLFEIPSLFSVPASHMLPPMLDRGPSYHEFVKMGALLARPKGIIVNSFESLEPKAVGALKDGTCLSGPSSVPPVYCLGPLLANAEDREEDGSSNECLKWLDLQPDKSVVYLCFGSGGVFSGAQTKEIAIGLERSGVRFLWVARAQLSLPDGFLERTQGSGFIVRSWAPQVKILAHRAVGGFVTHCGWNSILEAVASGVPMVAWPLYAEQSFNKIVVVQELKIALAMDEETVGRLVGSDQIEKQIRQIMCSPEGDAIRARVMSLSRDVRVALGEGGSSKMELTRFIQSWKK